MRYLFFLGHPAHFHLFKNIISELKRNGHKVMLLIRTKDILEQLCIESELNYVNVLPETRKQSLLSIAISYFKKYKRISKIIREFKPQLLLGSEPSLTHLGRFYKIPSLIFSEDDAAIIPQFAKIAYPFVDVIMSPKTCNAGKWEKKKIGYDGFHKLSYLHPEVFVPDENEIPIKEKYFILRFTQLNAYHDTDRSGINKDVAKKIIKILLPYGKVYITSERVLEPEFELYRLKLSPLKIHHLMFFAQMYIGDSQSMAVEAALLGTPGIRFNDFSGEIGVLNELEEKYDLTHSFKTTEVEKMLNKIKEVLSTNNFKEEYQKKRLLMLDDKINVFRYFVWFIEKYPESKQIMMKNPHYQYSFK